MAFGHFGSCAIVVVSCRFRISGGEVRTVRDGAVVCLIVVAVGSEGVADAGVLWLGEFLVDGIVEAL